MQWFEIGPRGNGQGSELRVAKELMDFVKSLPEGMAIRLVAPEEDAATMEALKELEEFKKNPPPIKTLPGGVQVMETPIGPLVRRVH